VLVIGVGSELRSDDAAGRRVAERLAAELEGEVAAQVEVRSVHQLTPELADEATGRRLVVVVDAAVDVTCVTTSVVEADGTPTALSHHLDAGALLRLTAVLGTPPDEVVTVAVPARELDLGTELSPATSRDVAVAVREIVARCATTLRVTH
jgi:hydrogenase maturation protease